MGQLYVERVKMVLKRGFEYLHEVPDRALATVELVIENTLSPSASPSPVSSTSSSVDYASTSPLPSPSIFISFSISFSFFLSISISSTSWNYPILGSCNIEELVIGTD